MGAARRWLGGGICSVAAFSLAQLLDLLFCIRYGRDDDGTGTTVVRNSAQVIDHATILLRLLRQ